jgi:hypothetical protein
MRKLTPIFVARNYVSRLTKIHPWFELKQPKTVIIGERKIKRSIVCLQNTEWRYLVFFSPFAECSAKNAHNVNTVFAEIVREINYVQNLQAKQQNGCCSIA